MNRQQRRQAARSGDRPKFARVGEKVVVGYICNGTVDLDFMESLLDMKQWDTQVGAKRFENAPNCSWRIRGKSSANISRARNTVCREFLNLLHEPSWLLLVDTDMAWQPDALERMMAVADPEKIVGGLCFAYGPEDRIIPTIFMQDEVGRFATVPSDYEVPDNTLLQVYGTGGAFLLVHRQALIRMANLMPFTPNPWFREHEAIIDNPKYDEERGEEPGNFKQIPYWVSEDLFFCQQALAAGITTWVHTGVEVGHRKPHFLTKRLYDEARAGLVTPA